MNIDIQNHSAEVSAEINAARAGKDRAGGRGYAKKPGTNPRPLSYICLLRAFAALMRILLAPHNETRQRGLKSKRSHACGTEFNDTLTRKGKLDLTGHENLL